jgi:hypothetical protein
MTENYGALNPNDGVHKLSRAVPGDLLQEVEESQEMIDQECAEFQALMPKRIEIGEDLQTFPHMLTCERCRALVRDLEYIAEVARQLIPIEEEPRDELWTQIQLAIERGEA